jgi:hypothetical protein
VTLAVDSGVCTGAVWFQIGVQQSPQGLRPQIRVFADYYAEEKTAYSVALDVLEISRRLCNGRLHVRVTDPAGGAKNPIGPTVLAEYQRAGLPMDHWPLGSVADGLALIESLVESADGACSLKIHPRCEHLINAFEGYVRKKSGTQWLDEPKDPQHPHEDLMDPLRGGLRHHFPEGTALPKPPHTRRPVRDFT